MSESKSKTDAPAPKTPASKSRRRNANALRKRTEEMLVAPAGPSNPPPSSPSATVAPLILASRVGGLGEEVAVPLFSKVDLTPEEQTEMLTLSSAQLHHLKERFRREFEAGRSAMAVENQNEDAGILKKQLNVANLVLDASQASHKEAEKVQNKNKTEWLGGEAELKMMLDRETDTRTKAQEKGAGREGELAAIKADLDDERARRKEEEANSAASRINVANERRRGKRLTIRPVRWEKR